MDLYYKIEEDGYWILDKNDSMFKIHQYEPYIPDPTKSYEDNAKAQIAELMSMVECTNDYGVPDELYNAIVDDYTMNLMEAGLI